MIAIRNNRNAIVVFAVVTIFLIGLPWERTRDVGSVVDFLVPSVTTTAIFAIIVIGLNIHWGYTGIFNFGILAFFMIGAYTAAILTKPTGSDDFNTFIGGWGSSLNLIPSLDSQEWLPFIVGIAAAAFFSGLLALLLGLASLRLREDYLAIALIGVAEILRRVVMEEQGLVNGTRGLGGIPRPMSGWFDSDIYPYVYFALVVAILIGVYVLVELALRSPWGRVLRAIREDEDAVSASGKSVFLFKIQGFVFGSALMGGAGALYSYQQGAISPDTFTHFFGTFIFWAMLIVGGSGNTLGAILGAYIIWSIWSITLQIQGYDLPAIFAGRINHLRDFAVGAIIVIALLTNSAGLLPERAQVSRWLEARVDEMKKAEAGSADQS